MVRKTNRKLKRTIRPKTRKTRKAKKTGKKYSKRVHFKKIKGGSNANIYIKLKQLAYEILNEHPHYSGRTHIVGSMAIALHEEEQIGKPNIYPNDLDIVFFDNNNLGQAPNIQGMTSENQTAAKGATFLHNKNKSLSIDVIREPERNMDGKIEIINDLRVLSVNQLKKHYREIINAWESEPEEIQNATDKMERLNALHDIDEDVNDTKQQQKTNSSLSKNLFADY